MGGEGGILYSDWTMRKDRGKMGEKGREGKRRKEKGSRGGRRISTEKEGITSPPLLYFNNMTASNFLFFNFSSSRSLSFPFLSPVYIYTVGIYNFSY